MAYFVMDCYPKTADFEPSQKVPKSRFFVILSALKPLILLGLFMQQRHPDALKTPILIV